MEIKNRNILVLGASGYIGTAIIPFFKKHYSVICLMRKLPEEPHYFEGTKILVGDILDNAILNEFSSMKVHAIINLISLDHYESEDDYEKALSTNLLPIFKLFKRENHIKTNFFINISTIHVYSQEQSVFDESSDLAPKNIYALTHKFAEDTVEYFCTKANIHGITLRLANSFGAPRNGNDKSWLLVINDLCKKALTQNKIIISSDGKALRDFIYYDNIAAAIHHILLQKHYPKHYDLYNLSSGMPNSIIDIAVLIQQIVLKKYRRNIDIYINQNQKLDTSLHLSQNERSDKNTTGVVTNAKLKLTGFKLQIDLKKGVEALLNEINEKSIS